MAVGVWYSINGQVDGLLNDFVQYRALLCNLMANSCVFLYSSSLLLLLLVFCSIHFESPKLIPPLLLWPVQNYETRPFLEEKQLRSRPFNGCTKDD